MTRGREYTLAELQNQRRARYGGDMSIIDDFAIFEREHGHPVPTFPDRCPPDCLIQRDKLAAPSTPNPEPQ